MTSKPHDALIREVFSHPEHAQGELQHLLPAELSARFDWSTLELTPGCFIDEKLKESYSDLLYCVQFNANVSEPPSSAAHSGPLPAGSAAYLYLLLEHQSTPDTLLIFRQLKYMVRIWERWVEEHPGATALPVVIPLLLCHCPTPWPAPTRFEDLLDIDRGARDLVLDFVPRFRTVVDDLTTQTDEQLRTRAMTELGRIVLWCLWTARHPDELVAGMARWSELFSAVRRAPNGVDAIRLVWQYIVDVHNDPDDRVLTALVAVLDEEQKEDMTTIADRFIEKGLKRGVEKGRTEGERHIVLRLLQRRFGALPAEAVERIERAAPGEVEQWADRLLTAASLAEVLEGAA